MSNHGVKLKQLAIPMDLYQLVLRRCVEERDTNTSRVILKWLRRALTDLPPDAPTDLPEIAAPLFPDDEGDRNQPEIVRLRKVFPNNEEEVQRQLKEIEIGLRQVGESEDNIRLILYGSEGKNE